MLTFLMDMGEGDVAQGKVQENGGDRNDIHGHMGARGVDPPDPLKGMSFDPQGEFTLPLHDPQEP